MGSVIVLALILPYAHLHCGCYSASVPAPHRRGRHALSSQVCSPSVAALAELSQLAAPLWHLQIHNHHPWCQPRCCNPELAAVCDRCQDQLQTRRATPEPAPRLPVHVPHALIGRPRPTASPLLPEHYTRIAVTLPTASHLRCVHQ